MLRDKKILVGSPGLLIDICLDPANTSAYETVIDLLNTAVHMLFRIEDAIMGGSSKTSSKSSVNLYSRLSYAPLIYVVALRDVTLTQEGSDPARMMMGSQRSSDDEIFPPMFLQLFPGVASTIDSSAIWPSLKRAWCRRPRSVAEFMTCFFSRISSP